MKLYKDVEEFVASCVVCQLQPTMKFEDILHLIYPLAIHFQLMINLVAMPLELWSIKYIFLAKKSIYNLLKVEHFKPTQLRGFSNLYLKIFLDHMGALAK